MAICPVCEQEYADDAPKPKTKKATCSTRCDSRARYRRLEGAPVSNREFFAYRAEQAAMEAGTNLTPPMAGGAWACGCGSRACRKGCRPVVTDCRRYQEIPT